MEIKIPEVGESVREALVAKWHVAAGELVQRDQPVCELETDKITLELNAEVTGKLTIIVPAGQTVPIGTVIGAIDETATIASPAPAPPAAPSAGQGSLFETTTAPPLAQPTPTVAAPPPPSSPPAQFAPPLPPPASPAVRKLARQQGIDLGGIAGSGPSGQVLVHDLPRTGPGERNAGTGKGPEATATLSVRSEESAAYGASPPPASPQPAAPAGGRETRTPMSPIRKRIAERLVAVRQQTAILTSFNEADLSAVKALRAKYREPFQKKYGVDLGYMGFFVKACVVALQEFPVVNARIDGSDIVQPNYCDIGIAVGADKGLVVPVLRGAEQLRIFEIEQQIALFLDKIKTNRLAIADLEGGTFTITNGGVYGSMLSTPILNPPQSGVLGMHAIQDRPVVRDGQIVIRPMMYLALSYDHRLIDGRIAVQFLKRIKETIEAPNALLMEG